MAHQETQEEIAELDCEVFGCVPTPRINKTDHDEPTMEIVCARCGNLLE